MVEVLPRTVMKAAMTVFSGVLIIVAIACITIGIILLARGGKTVEISIVAKEVGTKALGSGLIIVGFLMIVTCVVGILATFMDSHMLAIAYAVGMLVVVIATICVSFQFFTTSDSIETIVKDKIQEFWKDRKKPIVPNSGSNFTAMEGVQFTLGCCGMKGPDDYKQEKMPASCCPIKVNNCTPEKAHQDGCNDKLEKFLGQYSPYVKYFSMGSVLFEFIGFVIAAMHATFLHAKV